MKIFCHLSVHPGSLYNNAGLSLLLCTCTCTICQHKCLYRYIMLLKMICVRDSKDLISVGRLDRCSIKLQFTEKENLKKSYICKTYRSAAKITHVMLSLKITFFWTVAFSVLNILKNHKSQCLKENVQQSNSLSSFRLMFLGWGRGFEVGKQGDRY